MRLGLDIGTASIGWWLYAQDASGNLTGVIDGGVRIYSSGRDPKTGASLAVDRRGARSARRRRDRYLMRRTSLMRRLAKAGLMPALPEEQKRLEALDPFELRARGLDTLLGLTELGRALFHLNQRRGFKSNRNTDQGDNESGKIKEGTARLDQAMMAAGARTYGEFLHKRRAAADDPRRVPSVRTRLKVHHAEDGKEETGYDFYPGREHPEEEFHKLWSAQAQYYPELTDELRDVLFETIFFQRPLRAPKIGRCRYLDEERLPKAHPLTQRRVLYETLNALRVTAPGHSNRPLSVEERNRLLLLFDRKKPPKSLASAKVSFTAMARSLKLGPRETFSHDTGARDEIACDLVRMSLSHPDRFGPAWVSLDVGQQWEVVQRLLTQEDRAALIAWLGTEHGLGSERAAAVADAPLPQGHSRIGFTATQSILAALIDGRTPEGLPLTYDKAVAAAGLAHHSDTRTGEVLDALPYYGAVLEHHVIPGTQDPADDEITRHGRITNPTVHIGLNQLRRLVNRIIAQHGKPDQIVVELARDLKNSEEKRHEIEVTIKRNTAAAIARGAKLTELGITDTSANRLALRLWEELGPDVMNRCCPYSGQRISASMLFNGSCDVDHILPYSRTLDDSIANRILCLREANRQKRNQSPFETWGRDPEAWARITANLPNLPANKRWRFAPDAMERFEADEGFIARQLTDTQYLSRLARTYLDTLFTEGGHVWVVPGRTTEMLRRHWGLNTLLPDRERASKEKNRQDHRHHAIDAAVIGATDRSLVKRLADAAKAPEAAGREDVVRAIEPPWPAFRSDLKTQIDRMIVSHRADHGRIDPEAKKRGRDTTAAKLHNDTAYGLTGESRGGLPLVVTRKPLTSLGPGDIPKIRDPQLSCALGVATKDNEKVGFTQALEAFSTREGPYRGIRRVRLAEAINVISIKDKEGRPYKGYKGDSNHCYEVWRLPGGKLTHHIVTTFDAHQSGGASRPHPAAKRLLRLHRNDLVALDNSKFGPVIAKVEKFDANGSIEMAPHNEANVSDRYRKEKDDCYIRMRSASLIAAGARRVHVDEMGKVRDPGPISSRITV